MGCKNNTIPSFALIEKAIQMFNVSVEFKYTNYYTFIPKKYKNEMFNHILICSKFKYINYFLECMLNYYSLWIIINYYSLYLGSILL